MRTALLIFVLLVVPGFARANEVPDVGPSGASAPASQSAITATEPVQPASLPASLRPELAFMGWQTATTASGDVIEADLYPLRKAEIRLVLSGRGHSVYELTPMHKPTPESAWRALERRFPTPASRPKYLVFVEKIDSRPETVRAGGGLSLSIPVTRKGRTDTIDLSGGRSSFKRRMVTCLVQVSNASGQTVYQKTVTALWSETFVSFQASGLSLQASWERHRTRMSEPEFVRKMTSELFSEMPPLR